MWAAIKKAINSNLAKPLDVLLGELYNSHRFDIVNTYNKANEANGNAWNAIQKGQEIVNMMNDTGGKRYNITRAFNSFPFNYTGSGGCLRTLRFSVYNGSDSNYTLFISVDGQGEMAIPFKSLAMHDSTLYGNGNDWYAVLDDIEFKHGINIRTDSNYSRTFIYGIVQTER